jgi:hypothetical protein
MSIGGTTNYYWFLKNHLLLLTTASSKEVLEIKTGLVRTFSAFTYNK